MPDMERLPVRKLRLDLANYRTVHQPTELAAVGAMISISPDRFWALTQSLLQDGYLPTENIIVLQTGPKLTKMVVKEGNRRVAAMKLIHGFLSLTGLPIPANIAADIANITPEWIAANKEIPCTVYPAAEAATVDRIVTLAHGKGEKAGRDQWNAVARSRHNRDALEVSEPALDLLEKYLKEGKNVTAQQKARWAGEYSLSVLAEAMKRVAPRLNLSNAPALAAAYPAVAHRDEVEAIIHAIGQKTLGFDTIRTKGAGFPSSYGIPDAKPTDPAGPASTPDTPEKPSPKTGQKEPKDSSGEAVKPKAHAINDPLAVRKLLRDFAPKGTGREKVVSLKIEATNLDIKKTPLAFCFVLRSMFEISAKAYCKDHASAGGPSTKKADGSDKYLADLLRDITKHLTRDKTDKEMTKALHGAMTELGKHDGLLSVTSLNQLVHNPKFSVSPGDIATVFGNVFSLLEAMNN